MIKEILILVFLAFILYGCDNINKTASYDRRVYYYWVQKQIVNPDAPKNKAPVQEMPGYLATQIYNQRYLNNMCDKKKINTNKDAK